MNKVILMGRLSKDPELRYTQASQIPTCSFSIAVDRRRDKDGNTKADFINCVAWRQTAEFISKYFQKGSKMLVTGSLQVRDYENNEGKKVYVTEVIVDDVEFCESKKDAGSYQGGSSSTPVDSAPKASQDISGYFPLDANDAPF